MQQSLAKQLYPTKESMSAKSNMQKVSVYSNHYQITIDNSQTFTEWHLAIINADQVKMAQSDQKVEDAIPLDSRQQRQFFLNYYRQNLRKTFQHYAETGNTIYTPTIKDQKDKIILDGHEEYALVLTKTRNELTFDSLLPSKNVRPALQRMVNTFLKKILKLMNFAEWGRNKKYYNKNISTFVKEHDVRIYQGCTYVNEFLEGGLKLIVSPTNRIIRQKNMLQEFLDSDDFKKNKVIQNQFFKGKSALCIYNHRIIRLDGISDDLTLQSQFPDKGFKNYQEYYEKKYKMKFQDKGQFLVYSTKKIRVQKPNGQIVEELKQDNFPPELLLPTGLTDRMRSDYRVMNALGKITICRPEEKFRKIEEGLDLIDKNQSKVGLRFKINSKSNEIQGYYLTQPRILGKNFKGSTLQKPRIDVRDMCKTVHLTDWILFYDFKHTKDYVQVVKNIKKAASRFKINVADPFTYKLNKNFGPSDLTNIIQKRPNTQLIFFMVPPVAAKFLYKKMKAFLNNKGIASQFLTSYFFKRDQNNLSKFGNVVLQMSTKLGSCPWAIDLSIKNKQNTIIMGTDVFHDRASKSVVSLVTQFGEKFLNNYTSSKIIKQGKEISINLSEMVLEHVDYLKSQNVNIDQILFYRDGVAENQEDLVIDIEIRNIVEKLQKKYKNAPKLTFIIVTKRIDDRFGVTGKDGQLENPKGGFIVQDEVVKDMCANFFMIAQKVNQGTATPTHYKVILNQCDFKLPEIQKVTYDLAHFYYNWAGPVKVPSCVQYAHKCAYQIGVLQNDYVSQELQTEFHFL